MTEEFVEQIKTRAKLTSCRSQSASEIVRMICEQASMDDPAGYEGVFNLSYPLLEFVAKSVGLPIFSGSGTELHVSIQKEILTDLETARSVFISFGKEAAEKIVPDWRGKGMHTEILVRNLPRGEIYSENACAFKLALAFSEDGEFLNGQMFTSPPAEKKLGNFLGVDIQDRDVGAGTAIDALRILLDQIYQARSPRQGILTLKVDDHQRRQADHFEERTA